MLTNQLLVVCCPGCNLSKEEGQQRQKSHHLSSSHCKDIRSVIMLDSIPAKLIINWDYTGLNYVPASSRTLEVKGSQKFPIAAIDDKRQITVVLVCSLAGDFLPPHFIYGGKTPGCLPKASCPPGWHVTYINNHWANEESMLDYVHCIFLPFLEAAKKELKLPHNQPAWHYLIISEGN